MVPPGSDSAATRRKQRGHREPPSLNHWVHTTILLPTISPPFLSTSDSLCSSLPLEGFHSQCRANLAVAVLSSQFSVLCSCPALQMSQFSVLSSCLEYIVWPLVSLNLCTYPIPPLSLCPSSIHPSIYLYYPIYLSIYLFIHPSTHPLNNRSIDRSIHPPMHLPISLPVHPSNHYLRLQIDRRTVGRDCPRAPRSCPLTAARHPAI